MRVHKNLGIVLFIAGIASLMIGGYINKQAIDTRIDYTSTQTELDDGDRAVSRSSKSRQINDAIVTTTEDGTLVVARKDDVARIFELLGAVLAVAGVGLIIYSYYDRNRVLHDRLDPLDPRNLRDPRDPRDPRL